VAAPTTRSELIALVAPRLEEVVRRAARRAREEIPAYADVPEDDLREGIARDLSLAMTALVEERALTDEDRAAMSVIGDTRAQQGLPIEGMIRVYRITVDEVFATLWEAADSGLIDVGDVLTLTREAWRYAGPMMEGAVGAYRRRELELAVADSQRRTALVHSLLLSPRGAPPGLVSSAGLDPAGRYLAFRARRDTADEKTLLLDIQLPGVVDGALAAPYEGDVIGLATERPVTAPGADTVIGVGPAGGLDELPRSFALASRALETAAAFGRAGVVELRDVAFEAMARSEAVLGDELVARHLEPLAPDTASGREIVDTLRSFLEHELNAERAADELDVHPNTVRNRLRRFEELTGASLRSVEDLSEIRLALLRAQMIPKTRVSEKR
jgi:hypothetical protein